MNYRVPGAADPPADRGRRPRHRHAGPRSRRLHAQTRGRDPRALRAHGGSGGDALLEEAQTRTIATGSSDPRRRGRWPTAGASILAASDVWRWTTATALPVLTAHGYSGDYRPQDDAGIDRRAGRTTARPTRCSPLRRRRPAAASGRGRRFRHLAWTCTTASAAQPGAGADLSACERTGQQRQRSCAGADAGRIVLIGPRWGTMSNGVRSCWWSRR